MLDFDEGFVEYDGKVEENGKKMVEEKEKGEEVRWDEMDEMDEIHECSFKLRYCSS